MHLRDLKRSAYKVVKSAGVLYLYWMHIWERISGHRFCIVCGNLCFEQLNRICLIECCSRCLAFWGDLCLFDECYNIMSHWHIIYFSTIKTCRWCWALCWGFLVKCPASSTASYIKIRFSHNVAMAKVIISLLKCAQKPVYLWIMHTYNTCMHSVTYICELYS